MNLEIEHLKPGEEIPYKPLTVLDEIFRQRAVLSAQGYKPDHVALSVSAWLEMKEDFWKAGDYSCSAASNYAVVGLRVTIHPDPGRYIRVYEEGTITEPFPFWLWRSFR